MLAGHALAAGPGVNPLGDETVDAAGRVLGAPLPEGPRMSRDATSARVAAIDCGTNSIRLLVAEADGRGFVEFERDLHLTRLGQGVDATGEFHPDALVRTFAACDDYAPGRGRHGVGRVRFVATSAARDAGNREAFFAGVRERLGRRRRR